MDPADFEAHCRDNYRLTVYDDVQWKRYVSAVIAQAKREGRAPDPDDSHPFELQGQVGAEPSLLFPEPVPFTRQVMLEGRIIARIDDFLVHVSDRDYAPSACSRFERHALRTE